MTVYFQSLVLTGSVEALSVLLSFFFSFVSLIAFPIGVISLAFLLSTTHMADQKESLPDFHEKDG